MHWPPLPSPGEAGTEGKGDTGGGPWAEEGGGGVGRGMGTLRASYKVHRCVCVSRHGEGAAWPWGQRPSASGTRRQDSEPGRDGAGRGVRDPRGPPAPGVTQPWGSPAGVGRRGGCPSWQHRAQGRGDTFPPGPPWPVSRPPQAPWDTQPDVGTTGRGSPAVPCPGRAGVSPQ